MVNFKNCVIIMTSNLGSEHLVSGVGSDGVVSAEVEQRVRGAVRAHFRPELLNRMDSIVLFSPLSRSDLRKVVAIQMRGLDDRLAERDVRLELPLRPVGHHPPSQPNTRPPEHRIGRKMLSPLRV